jgi:hypothetical protein
LRCKLDEIEDWYRELQKVDGVEVRNKLDKRRLEKENLEAEVSLLDGTNEDVFKKIKEIEIRAERLLNKLKKLRMKMGDAQIPEILR